MNISNDFQNNLDNYRESTSTDGSHRSQTSKKKLKNI